MTALELLANLRARGVTVEVDGADIMLDPAAKVTEADIAEARRLKADLLGLLTAPAAGAAAGVDHRVAAFQRQLGAWARTGAPGVPLLTLPDVAILPGACVGCGAALGAGRTWRCLCARRRCGWRWAYRRRERRPDVHGGRGHVAGPGPLAPDRSRTEPPHRPGPPCPTTASGASRRGASPQHADVPAPRLSGSGVGSASRSIRRPTDDRGPGLEGRDHAVDGLSRSRPR